MSSYTYGKDEVCAWIRENFPPDATVLDVGACDGLWRRLLPEYTMDAVEAYAPNVARLTGYRAAIQADIMDYRFKWYDLIIFGDVLEHLNVEDAQALLKYSFPRCRDMIVAVPFLYPQGAIYGNPYEVHRQPDLTPAVFAERYPGLVPLIMFDGYAYYRKEKTNG